MRPHARAGLTRRQIVQAGAGAAAAGAIARYGPLASRAAAAGGAVRGPGYVRDPSRPLGVADPSMPFDHIVIVMMENHSFDNYLGMLPRRGQPLADGFTFDATGRPVDSQPYKSGWVTVQRAASHCQPQGVSQSWAATHHEVNGGAMDGFANQGLSQMQYWDEYDIPFYYSLAKTFCTGDRWFCSAPCQTYPNRRFMLAGTAFGLTSTDVGSITENPPNGTVFDRLNAHGVSWRNYFSDVPATGVIASVPARNPTHLAPIVQFELDCLAGNLPAVSFVDSDIGLLGEVSDRTLGVVPAPFGPPSSRRVGALNFDEEDPADIALGETFVHSVVKSVLNSPLWPRILLVWTYDEHGGYYDHVPPPAAIPPDSIKPRLKAGDPPGGYDVYGPRVPSVVVSGYAKPNAITSTLHDHTSILATIQAKWNLPAMTYRDANAMTLMDFLSDRVTFPEPPALAAPYDLVEAELQCSLSRPVVPVHSAPPREAVVSPGAAHLTARVAGRRGGGALVALRTRLGTVKQLTVELVQGRRIVARAPVAHVSTARHTVVLRRPHGARLAAGRYALVVRSGGTVVLRNPVRLS